MTKETLCHDSFSSLCTLSRASLMLASPASQESCTSWRLLGNILDPRLRAVRSLSNCTRVSVSSRKWSVKILLTSCGRLKCARLERPGYIEMIPDLIDGALATADGNTTTMCLLQRGLNLVPIIRRVFRGSNPSLCEDLSKFVSQKNAC